MCGPTYSDCRDDFYHLLVTQEEVVNIGSAGIALIKQFESCRLAAYQDQVGVWTIGFGHTGGVQPTDTCTQAQADQWLQADCRVAVGAVNRLVTSTLTQNMFDALVDFVYNEGEEHFAESTLLIQLNACNYAAAAAQFPRWDYAGGVIDLGLMRRRAAEQELFNAPA